MIFSLRANPSETYLPKATHNNDLRGSNAANSEAIVLVRVVRRDDPRGIEVEVVAAGGGARGSRPIVAAAGLIVQAEARVEGARVNASPRTRGTNFITDVSNLIFNELGFTEGT
jgi:hypothetical protein